MTDKSRNKLSELAGIKPPESDFGNLIAEALAKRMQAPKVEEPPAPPTGAGFAYPYFNRFYLWANPRIVRLILGSSVNEEEPSWQQSFALDREIAAELIEALKKLLEDTEPDPKSKPKA